MLKEIEAVFERYPDPVKARLLALRSLVLDTAASTEGVGELEETLRWGQPTYLTTRSKSGTMIRIDRVKSAPNRYGLFVHCQTSLVETFKDQYPGEFVYDGNRGLLFEADEKLPMAALRHCIRLALTYRLRKRRSKS